MENTRVGPFLIAQRLGNNRRQRVFRATQTEQERDVALKFIGIPGNADRSKAIEKIQIEVDILRQLQHPNLVPILGAGVEGDDVFFAMELIDGESLTAILSRRGKFAEDQVVDVGRQIARLLDYLHQQDIIHSKLTPDKILIEKDGTARVSDLRLNRSRKKRWDSPRKRELDIAAYMAPEQFTEGATTKSDIYSLGVILYEMLTGKLPYEPDTLGRMARRKMEKHAPPISSFLMNCPTWLDNTVCQMISPDPRERPHSAKAVILAMNELKEIDRNRTAAIAKVGGGFNALTAGADRTEAERILGTGEKWKFDPSIFQSAGAMLLGLLIVVGFLTFALWPESYEQKFERAQKLMLSDQPADWREARTVLRPVIESNSKLLSGPAEELYFESRRRTLLSQAQKGRTMGLQTSDTQAFIKAFQLKLEKKYTEAIKAFREIVDRVDPEGEEQFIYAEAKTQIAECESQVRPESGDTPKPDDTTEPDAASIDDNLEPDSD